MASEAKFSVIFSASGITNAQIETFEETAQRNNLPVSLPLRSDSNGNLIIASGMTLRNAQILRRQIVGYGFSADVVSDSVNTPRQNQNPDGSPTTLVVELNSIEPGTSEQPSASWGSMDMSNLDLGLSDGDVLDGNAEWSGDNWLSPDSSASRTLSVNAQDLLEVARGAEQVDLEDVNAVQAIPLLETLSKASQKGSEPVKPLLRNNLPGMDENDKPTVTNLMRESLDIETESDNQAVPELKAEKLEGKDADSLPSVDVDVFKTDVTRLSTLETCISATANAPEKFVVPEDDSVSRDADNKAGESASDSQDKSGEVPDGEAPDKEKQDNPAPPETLSDLSAPVTVEDSQAPKHRVRSDAPAEVVLESASTPAKSSKSVFILVGVAVVVAAALIAAYFLGFI